MKNLEAALVAADPAAVLEVVLEAAPDDADNEHDHLVH